MNALSLHVSSDREPLAMPDERVGDEGLREILPIQSDYPDRLRQMAKAPTVWLRGRAELLSSRPICTVVGSRACSRLAEARALELGRKLGERGVLVVSGGALGIDAAAHTGALAAGGATCAVLGTGVDRLYPQQNVPLLAALARTGLLLSMFSLGAPPRPFHFRVRNELMAALADVVVVVEAQANSGSLITARHALRFGRPLLGFQGSEGTMSLFSAGAQAVHSVDEVVEFVASRSAGGERPGAPSEELARVPQSIHVPTETMLLSDEDAAKRVLAALAATASADVGEVCARTGLSAAECAAVLVDLELADRCTRLAGGRYIVHAPLS